MTWAPDPLANLRIFLAKDNVYNVHYEIELKEVQGRKQDIFSSGRPLIIVCGFTYCSQLLRLSL
jgi:hypothetical protein